MADLDAWHRDEARYKREALGVSDQTTNGEEQRPLPGMMFKSAVGADNAPMSWKQFRNFYAKCHRSLAKVIRIVA